MSPESSSRLPSAQLGRAMGATGVAWLGCTRPWLWQPRAVGHNHSQVMGAYNLLLWCPTVMLDCGASMVQFGPAMVNFSLHLVCWCFLTRISLVFGLHVNFLKCLPWILQKIVLFVLILPLFAPICSFWPISPFYNINAINKKKMTLIFCI